MECETSDGSTAAVLVPNEKLQRCELYKRDAQLLDGAQQDAKKYRLELGRCEGELSATEAAALQYQAKVDALTLYNAQLRAEAASRWPWYAWIGVGVLLGVGAAGGVVLAL
jgi:hypothetical protein